MERHLDRNHIGTSEDWHGNNAAFTCPVCGKVFIVSGLLNRNGRKCPGCGKSTGIVTGGKDSGGTATITWA
jgi:transcription elongation factor Elf1